jgi:hypothetical protein
MIGSTLTLTLVLLLPAAAPEKSSAARTAHPFAPSLPDLTQEQEEAFDRIIDRMIRAEAGRLTGRDVDRAFVEFRTLPPESIFALIRGLNRSATLDSPRPAAAMGRKIAAILRSTNDVSLLEFAHENIGAHAPRPTPKQSAAEVEARYDRIVDAFILYDLGKLRGLEGQQAKRAFEQLPPESIFALIRGLNRAAIIDQSCPAMVIGKKVRALLNRSRDAALLDYAIENIASSGKAPRHLKVIDEVLTAAIARKKEVAPAKRGLPKTLVEDLRLLCTHRKSEVARGGGTTGTSGATASKRYLIFRPGSKKPTPPSTSPGDRSPGMLKPPSR